MNATDFVLHLQSRGLSPRRSGTGWQARCAGHDDRNASLSISTGADRRILLKCHAGCSAESIVAALGLTLGDLFPPRDGNGNHSKPRIVAAYDYQDENGKPLFQCVRFEPKDFRQRRPDPAKPGEWIWNLKDTRRVLYRLREAKAAIAAGRTIFVAEGEKDCGALVKHGFAATCNPMGAGKWLPEHTATLQGAARVVVIADKDTPGRNHAQAVAVALHGVAKSVKVIELPDVNGKTVKDTFDFFAAGGTADALRGLVKAAPEVVPAVEPPPTKPGSAAGEYLSSGDETGGATADEAALLKLAALPLLEYERCRENESKLLKIRVGTLDKLLDARRPKSETADGDLQGRTLNLADVDLWPDAVNGADVLSEIAETFARYVALPEGAGDALALWTAHAHCFESFMCSPRLNISSPEKGCGKTTLRDALAVLVPRPLATENLSVAVLFRVIESRKPTVLADECDAWLRDNEELRGMLNAGHRRGGQALRCEGESNEVRAFNVFAPAVLCGIGALPGTLHDRSIVIRLERAKPGELRERFDSRRVDRESELCRKLARWCADNASQLESCDPALPDGAFNRLADNWRPLFAIAGITGGDWPQRAADAFGKLTSREDSDAQGVGAVLLADIAETFAVAGVDKLPSAGIVEALARIEGREWAEWGRARKPISTNQLAKLLRRFNVLPRTIKLPDGSTAKGYHREMFNEAFTRYLPQSPLPNRNPVTIHENIDDSTFSETSPAQDGLRVENEKITNNDAEGDAVTVQQAGMLESEALIL